jgi:CheY-like chemotaxis protein
MGASPVVLVVEDEWLLRDCIAAHLRAVRWSVLQARTGEIAVSLLAARRHIDIVFTDIRLAGSMSGWDVAAAFRKAHPKIPVIYTSGDPLNAELAVPESVFIAKPYEPATIVEACRRYWGERSPNAEKASTCKIANRSGIS